MSVKGDQVGGDLLQTQSSVGHGPTRPTHHRSCSPTPAEPHSTSNATRLGKRLTSLVFHLRLSLGRRDRRGRLSSSLLGRNTFLGPLFSTDTEHRDNTGKELLGGLTHPKKLLLDSSVDYEAKRQPQQLREAWSLHTPSQPESEAGHLTNSQRMNTNEHNNQLTENTNNTHEHFNVAINYFLLVLANNRRQSVKCECCFIQRPLPAWKKLL